MIDKNCGTAEKKSCCTAEYFRYQFEWERTMRNKTYIWNKIVQKALEIAYIAALCVFMVLFFMLLIIICIIYSLADCTVRRLEKDGCL